MNLSMESSPDVINKILQRLGVHNVQAIDIVSLDPSHEDEQYKAVFGILLTIHRDMIKTPEEDEEQEGVFYVQKKEESFGGLISLVNILANGGEGVKFDDGSILKNWIDSAKDQSPEEKGRSLAGSSDIIDAFKEIVAENHAEDNDVTHQIISFVQANGSLLELNGITENPVKIGDSEEDELVENVVRNCIDYIQGEEDAQFSLLALIYTDL